MPPRSGSAQRCGRTRAHPVFGCSRQLRFATVAGAPRRAIALSGAPPLGGALRYMSGHPRLPSAVA
eukprot:3488527-Alexandrium_andersonii.AAC.1